MKDLHYLIYQLCWCNKQNPKSIFEFKGLEDFNTCYKAIYSCIKCGEKITYNAVIEKETEKKAEETADNAARAQLNEIRR
jgi:hypothetical protein